MRISDRRAYIQHTSFLPIILCGLYVCGIWEVRMWSFGILYGILFADKSNEISGVVEFGLGNNNLCSRNTECKCVAYRFHFPNDMVL